MADSEAGTEKAAPELRSVRDCYSCQVISDGLCFVAASYLAYHTYSSRLAVFGRERIKLYMVNGLLGSSKCILSFFTNKNSGINNNKLILVMMIIITFDCFAAFQRNFAA